MKKLEEIFINGSEEDREDALKKAVRAQLDKEFRSELEADLNKEHGITRSHPPTKARVLPFSIKALSIAASFIILIGAALWLIPFNSSSVEMLANKYIQEPFLHPGMTKGASDANDNRRLAIESFNAQNYASAIKFYQMLGENQSTEDKFYLGLSLLKTSQSDKSCSIFQGLSDQNSGYQEEVRWYLSLCLLLSNRSEDAKAVLDSFQSGDWKYSEAQRLLRKLD